MKWSSCSANRFRGMTLANRILCYLKGTIGLEVYCKKGGCEGLGSYTYSDYVRPQIK